MSAPCHRCGTLTDALLITPQLRLCAKCPQQEPCAPWHHEWHGSVPAGTWVCVRCAATMDSVGINTEPVGAPHPTEEWI